MTSRPALDPQNILALMYNEHQANQKIQIISQSAHTPISQYILSNMQAIRVAGIKVEAIFLRVDGDGYNLVKLRATTDMTNTLGQIEYRQVNFNEAGNIFEQVNFGGIGIWTGNRLKACDSLDIQGGQITDIRGSEDSFKMASMAFKSLWLLSEVQKITSKDYQDTIVPMRLSGVFGR